MIKLLGVLFPDLWRRTPIRFVELIGIAHRGVFPNIQKFIEEDKAGKVDVELQVASIEPLSRMQFGMQPR